MTAHLPGFFLTETYFKKILIIIFDINLHSNNSIRKYTDIVRYINYSE